MNPRVLIVGGGPAGLTAAAKLASRLCPSASTLARSDNDPGSSPVLVVEREAEAGGIPRHSDHRGYGIRDLCRCLTGPAYARLLADRARRAGAQILTSTMVTDWLSPIETGAAGGGHRLLATGPAGRLQINATAVILATGARERSQAARLIPGDRAHGALTTGELQNLIYLKAAHLKSGWEAKQAVIVGAELVSWSAALTLKHAGCKTVLLISEYPQPEAYALVGALGRRYFKTRVVTCSRVSKIMGKPRVQAVELENLDTGVRKSISCDLVVLTGSWIADSELARSAAIPLQRGSGAPLVDQHLHSCLPGVFAAGNLLHPVDTAGNAALEGMAAARSVLLYLVNASAANTPTIRLRLRVEPPLRWIHPAYISFPLGAFPSRLVLWSDAYSGFPLVFFEQNGRLLGRQRLPWSAAPGRIFRVPTRVLLKILRSADPADGDVTIALSQPG